MVVCDIYSSLIDQKRLKPEVVCYYYRDYRDGFYMQPHTHKRAEIMYVTKGMCKVNTDNNQNRLEQGDYILINGDVEHQLVVGSEQACRILCLEFVFVEDINNNFPHLGHYNPNYQHFFNEKRNYIVLKDNEEVFFAVKGIFCELERQNYKSKELIWLMMWEMFQKILRQFSEQLSKNNSAQQHYVDKAVSFIEKNYMYDITLKDISKHVSLNPTYLERLFKKLKGKTPMEYLTSLRIEKAKMLLINSDIPVTEICHYVGINSRQYFSYLFKKFSGLSPRKFRQVNYVSRNY